MLDFNAYMTLHPNNAKPVLRARKAVPATRRRAMTQKRRKAVLERSGGLCRVCLCALDVSSAEIDHTIPLELGGEDEIENLQPLCKPCHRAKTTEDIKRIAKARRLRKREEKPPDPQRQNRIKSRGFVKHLSRGFDGRVKARVPKADRDNLQHLPLHRRAL